jgi:hypothetical protein
MAQLSITRSPISCVHNQPMRVLAAALILLATATAFAKKPARPRFDDDDYYYKPAPQCPKTGTWAKLQKCQFREATDVQLLRDLPTAKLVAYAPRGYTAGMKRLELYLLANGAWTKSGFYAETSPSAELIAFEVVAGDVFRLDMGYASSTWVTLDEMNTRPAMLRRRYTYFCSMTHGCRSVLSACDVLVHGKAVSTFHGDVKWTGTQLEIRGDGRGTNRYCTKPPNLIEASE